MLFRALGTFGLGAFFLVISPPLRETVADQIAATVAFVEERGPWSYCALALAGLAFTMVWIHRASHPR